MGGDGHYDGLMDVVVGVSRILGGAFEGRKGGDRKIEEAFEESKSSAYVLRIFDIGSLRISRYLKAERLWRSKREVDACEGGGHGCQAQL